MGDESLECLGPVLVEEGVEMGEEEMVDGQEDEDSLASTQNPDYREERFRVDRRKLEQLLQATKDERKNAEEFFTEIMQETNTNIMWPAKLKIGAKSKKDPLIKVCGLKDAVLLAKEKIMSTLNTKSLRVTLKMEVSHTEHSHVIGKGGNNIQRVMQETDCHIHFPDSNRNNLGEKSNQVSVTGQCPSVESARVKIRMLLPIVILFELPSSASPPVHLDSSSAVFHQIQKRYGVSVVAKQHLQPGHGYVQTIIVRGSVCNAKSVEEAAVVLFETLTGQTGTSFSVTLLMDIAPSHHPVIIGYDGSNIKQVIRRTGATIYFPNTTTSGNSPRSTLYITGAIPNVFHARQELMGWLPVVLMFDVKEDNEVEPSQITQLMEQLDVFISLKPKAKQPLKSVIVKSTERNISNVYEARRLLLSLMTETPSSSSLSNALLSATTGTKLSVASRTDLSNSVSSSPIYQLPFSSATANRSPIRSPTILPTYITASRGFQPVIILPSVQSYHLPVAYSSTPCLPAGGNFPVTVKVPPSGSLLSVPNKTSPLIVSSQQQALQQDSSETNTPSKLATSLSWSSGLSMAERSENLITSNLLLSPNRSASHEIIGSSLKPQNVSAFDDTTSFFGSHSEKTLLGNAKSFDVSKMMSMDTDSLLKLCLQNSTTYSNATNQSRDLAASPQTSTSKPSLPLYRSTDINSNLSLLTSGQSLKSMTASAFCETDPGSPSACQAEPSPPASRRFGQLPSPNNQNPHFSDDSRDLLLHSSQNVAYELCGTNVPDPSKAPGRGRPKKSICSSFLTTDDLFSDFDYEEKKLSATRAMQQKPVGDSRIPTDCWSGLYFSKSMPDSALCDKLNHNMFRFRASAMAATSENAEAETEDNSWKSAMPSNDYSLVNPSLDRFQCSAMPDSHSYESASDLNNIAAGLMSSHDFSGEKSSQVKVEAPAFSSPLSTLSEIWQPKVKESDPPQPCDLAELFSKLGLGKYTDLFQQQEIDLSTFLTLTENDLKELGISTFGARRKMLLAIADHNERQCFIPPPPGLPNPFRDPNVPRHHDAGSQSGRW